MVCSFFGSLFYSVSVLAVKATANRVPLLEVCLARSGLSWIISVALMLALGIHPMFGHRRNWPLLASRGVYGALAMYLNYVSLAVLPLGDAIAANMLSPPITAIAAWLVLKRLTRSRSANWS